MQQNQISAAVQIPRRRWRREIRSGDLQNDLSRQEESSDREELPVRRLDLKENPRFVEDHKENEVQNENFSSIRASLEEFKRDEQ